jgi:hypothetical protein
MTRLGATQMYLPTRLYHAIADFLAAVSGVDRDAIVIALGERWNVWPNSIRKYTEAQS